MPGKNTPGLSTPAFKVSAYRPTADVVLWKGEGSTYDGNETRPLRMPDEFTHGALSGEREQDKATNASVLTDRCVFPCHIGYVWAGLLVIVDDRQIRNVPNGLHRSTQAEAQSAYDS